MKAMSGWKKGIYTLGLVLAWCVLAVCSAQAAEVSITAKDVQSRDIGEHNAIIRGTIRYSSGRKPSQVGLYLGSSRSSMSRVSSEKLSHNKNPFDIWYDVNGELGLKLESGTEYYYTFYAVLDGSEYTGQVKSFRTSGTAEKSGCSHPSYDGRGRCQNCGAAFSLTNRKDLGKVTVICTKDNAAIHTEPYGDAPISARGRYGAEYIITASAENAFGNLWYQLDNGLWIVYDYVEMKAECPHISYNSLGYCSSCSAEFPLQNVTNLGNKAMTCVKENAAIHDRPYGDAPIISRGNLNGSYTAVKRAENAYGNTWYQLDNGGWMVQDYLEAKKASLNYDIDAAVNYAVTNYNKLPDSVKCAEFVYRCVKQGGLVPNGTKVKNYTRTKPVADYLESIGFEVHTLSPVKVGKDYRYRASTGNVAVGDVILYQCSEGSCGGAYKHVALVTAVDGNGDIYVTQTNVPLTGVLAGNYVDNANHQFRKNSGKQTIYCYHYPN